MLEIIQKLIIDWLNLQKYENIYFKNLIPLAWVFGGSSEFKNILEFFKALLLPLTKRLEFSLNWGNYIALNQAPKTCQERSIQQKLTRGAGPVTTHKSAFVFVDFSVIFRRVLVRAEFLWGFATFRNKNLRIFIRIFASQICQELAK